LKLTRKIQRPRNMMGKAGDGDRMVQNAKPKHLFAGKRTIGKTDRR